MKLRWDKLETMKILQDVEACNAKGGHATTSK